TDLALWLRDVSIDLDRRTQDLCKAFLALAERSSDIIMPSFTHLQRAQPISAGAEALAWCSMLFRDKRRLASGLSTSTLETCPLGSGAIAGSSLQIDPDITSAALGFRNAPRSSIDHTATRDAGCDFVYACAMTMQDLSRWAE